MKDFLWLVGDAPQGRILDLGPVWQSTVSFFTGRGFRLSTEDLMRSWMEFRTQAELHHAASRDKESELNVGAVADEFLRSNLVYPAESFHGVLGWDVFDYLEGEILTRVVARLYDLLRTGGVLMAAFHSSRPNSFHRYRVLDPQTVEMVPAPHTFRSERVFQNREILSLFGRFRSSRTYVGRDQIREGLFSK